MKKKQLKLKVNKSILTRNIIIVLLLATTIFTYNKPARIQKVQVEQVLSDSQIESRYIDIKNREMLKPPNIKELNSKLRGLQNT